MHAYVCVWKQDEYRSSKAGRLLWPVIIQLKRRPVAEAVLVVMTDWPSRPHAGHRLLRWPLVGEFNYCMGDGCCCRSVPSCSAALDSEIRFTAADQKQDDRGGFNWSQHWLPVSSFCAKMYSKVYLVLSLSSLPRCVSWTVFQRGNFILRKTKIGRYPFGLINSGLWSLILASDKLSNRFLHKTRIVAFFSHLLHWKHIRDGCCNGQCEQEEGLQQEKPVSLFIWLTF